MNIQDYQQVHIVGIGGINTSAIARFFRYRNAEVSGSDVALSDITASLETEGVRVYRGHAREHVAEQVDLLIYSEAIPEKNDEVLYAQEHNIPTMNASSFWAAYAKNMSVIAVSGTNGKSTTTALMGMILEQAGWDPTVVVGTLVPHWGGNIRIGNSEWLVIEADEYLGKMLKFRPSIAVITNIRADHLDYYKGLDDIKNHFQRWISSIKDGGMVVLNRDDPASDTFSIPRTITKKTFCLNGTTGVRNAGTVKRSNPDGWRGYTEFNLVDDEEDWGLVQLRVPGDMNIENALAAAVASDALGIAHRDIITALNAFRGTWRRFEYVGTHNGAHVISDYAHHPDGIKRTLAGAREWYPFETIRVVFQPHHHNRTKHLLGEFAHAFDRADEVIISEIYDVAGREKYEDQAVSSQDMVAEIKKHNPNLSVLYAKDLRDAESMIKRRAQPGDIVLIMGAGDVDSIARSMHH